MKKTMLTFAIVAATVAASAQGRVSFANDSLHMAVYKSDPKLLLPGDSSLAGQAVTALPTPSGFTMMADLYMGTSSSTLYLYDSTTFSATAGLWSHANVQAFANPATGAPLLLGGTSVYAAVQVRDSLSTPQAQLSQFGLVTYWGLSSEFTFTLGSAGYASLYGGSANWPPENIEVWVPLPEPSSLGLLGLGAALSVWRQKRRP